MTCWCNMKKHMSVNRNACGKMQRRNDSFNSVKWRQGEGSECVGGRVSRPWSNRFCFWEAFSHPVVTLWEGKEHIVSKCHCCIVCSSCFKLIVRINYRPKEAQLGQLKHYFYVTLLSLKGMMNQYQIRLITNYFSK